MQKTHKQHTPLVILLQSHSCHSNFKLSSSLFVSIVIGFCLFWKESFTIRALYLGDTTQNSWGFRVFGHIGGDIRDFSTLKLRAPGFKWALSKCEMVVCVCLCNTYISRQKLIVRMT